MSMHSRSALVAFAVLTGLVACSGTPKAVPVPVPVVVSFRRGDIDTSAPHGMRRCSACPPVFQAIYRWA